jgi:hypothetical protein
MLLTEQDCNFFTRAGGLGLLMFLLLWGWLGGWVGRFVPIKLQYLFLPIKLQYFKRWYTIVG